MRKKKKKISFLFISVALASLIGATIIPHHHHDTYLWFSEECSNHLLTEDEHHETSHENETEEKEFTQCISKANYYSDVHSKDNYYQKDSSTNLFTFFIVNELYSLVCQSRQKSFQDCEKALYTLKGNLHCNGLRAPPVFYL